ncbi:hypothetical protein Tco_1235929 [Tanacetum coccineum]
MSSSNTSPRDYSRKHKREILEPWRQCHNPLPSPPFPPPNRTSPPLSPSNSLPISPPNSPIFDTTSLPPSPNSSNPTSSSLPPQISTQNHSENKLHELLPSLDIALSLSPITPLENLSSPPSPSPPPPQPLIMRHPLYYNYHGSTCICCFHNCNHHLNLRDEMNIMFAHLEYLLTTAFTTMFHLHHRPFSNGLIMENPKTYVVLCLFILY